MTPPSAAAGAARERLEAASRAPSALNLALTRVVVCALLLGSSELWDAAAWAEAGRALRAPDYGLGWALPLLESSAYWLPFAQGLCALGATLGLLGWRARWSLPLTAAAASVLFALPHFTGAPRHSMHLLWFVALLAVSPCALRLRLPWWNTEAAPAQPEPGLRLASGTLWALLGVVYFFPGFWKLREAGAGWIWSDNLQNQMYGKWYEFGTLPSWRPDAHPTLLRLAALGVVGFELGFPLLLWRRSTRLIAAAAGVAFHWAAALYLLLPFQALLACYVALVDWEWLWAWLHDASEPDSRGSLAGFARTVAQALRGRLGARGRWLAAWAALLLGGSVAAGAAGAMQAYPFACYPTFQFRATPDLPDLWISVEHGGQERWLPDSPALGGVRPQARWGMAWRASGAYGEPVRIEQLIGYYQTLPAELRQAVQAGDRVRFYAVRVRVQPEQWRAPPLRRQLIGEWLR